MIQTKHVLAISEAPKHTLQGKTLVIKLFCNSVFRNHIFKITIPPTHTTGEFTVGKAYISMILLSTNSQSEERRVRCIQHHAVSEAQNPHGAVGPQRKHETFPKRPYQRYLMLYHVSESKLHLKIQNTEQNQRSSENWKMPDKSEWKGEMMEHGFPPSSAASFYTKIDIVFIPCNCTLLIRDPVPASSRLSCFPASLTFCFHTLAASCPTPSHSKF